jgi:hypothetical protein
VKEAAVTSAWQPPPPLAKEAVIARAWKPPVAYAWELSACPLPPSGVEIFVTAARSAPVLSDQVDLLLQ